MDNVLHPSKEEAVHECVSEDALVHLKSYKYSSVDNSLLTRYVMRHYWNASVNLLPLWLAPNMVTLIGFFFILGNVALLEIYIPDLIGPGPSWVYFSFAFGLFMYQTMDNLDGKQARRTGQSSGLGELFDHGIDSLNCTLASLLETAAIGLGTKTTTSAFTALVPCLPMFFSTWETYHTHTLYLGYFNGPTEGLLIACLFIITTGTFGPEVWRTPLSQYPLLSTVFASLPLPENPYLNAETSLLDIWIPFILFSFFSAHLPECLSNVIRARRAAKLPVAPIFLEWTPMIIYTASIMGWLFSPYSTLLAENHLVLFSLTMSFVFGRMTTKIILAHLTRQPFPYWTYMLLPLVIGAVLANLPRLPISGPAVFLTPGWELAYLRGYFLFAAVAYTRWAVVVVGSICRYLDINALTITPRLLPPELKRKWNIDDDKSSRGSKTAANGLANGTTDDQNVAYNSKSLRNRNIPATPAKN